MRISQLVVCALIIFLLLPVSPLMLAKASEIFADGFETGDFSAWSGMNNPTYSVVEVVSTPVHHGFYSCHLSNTAHDVEPKVWKDFTSTETAYARVYVRFANLGWSSEKRGILITLGMASYPFQSSQVSVYNNGGTYVWRLDMQDDDSNAFYSISDKTVLIDIWYCVEIKKVADATAGECRLYIDGQELLSITGKDTETTGKCDRFLVDGETYGEVSLTNNYFDCAIIADGYIGPEVSDVIPPTFGNISTNTTIAGQSCSFNCLVNDDTNVSAYIFSTNNTGVWTNDTAVEFLSFFNETAAWANVTKTLNGVVGEVVSYLWYANDTSNNWSRSGQYNLTMTAMQRYLTVVSPYATTGGQGWYNDGSTAYATLDTGVVDQGNGTRRVFTNWSGDATGTDYTSSDPIAMNANNTAVALWKTQYLLTVNTDPGDLDPQPARDPTGDPESSNSWWYDTAPDVALTAQTVAGYTFNYWTVDSNSQGNGVNPIAVTMDGPHIAIAHYVLSDVTPPEITVISPQNSTYYSSTVPLEFKVNETTSWIGYSLDGQANVTISGNTTLTVGEGSHSVVVCANDTSGNIGSSNTVYFTARTGVIDIAVILIRLSKDVVCQNYSMLVDVTVKNEGYYVESFNVTLYANNTKIIAQPVTLNPGENTTLTFTWNTTGFSIYEKYNITATLDQMPGELHTADNTLSGGTVVITHLGDINGDGVVDIQDLARVSGAFGSVRISDRNDPRYWQYWHPTPCEYCPHTPNADINNDGIIDIQDLARTSANFGWHES